MVRTGLSDLRRLGYRFHRVCLAHPPRASNQRGDLRVCESRGGGFGRIFSGRGSTGSANSPWDIPGSHERGDNQNDSEEGGEIRAVGQASGLEVSTASLRDRACLIQLSCQFLFGGVIWKPGALQPGEGSPAWLNRSRDLFYHSRSEEHTSELQSQSNLVC